MLCIHALLVYVVTMVDGGSERWAKGQAEYCQNRRNPTTSLLPSICLSFAKKCIAIGASHRFVLVSRKDSTCHRKRPRCTQSHPQRGMQACSLCCRERLSVVTR